MAVIYTAFESISISSDATQDLWSLMAPSDRRLRLLGFEITSSTLTATLLALTLQHINAVGSAGSTAIEVDADSGSEETIVGSVRTGDTTPGTADGELMAWEWEQVGPVGHIWTPEMAPRIALSHGIALNCRTAAAFTMSGWVCWEAM